MLLGPFLFTLAMCIFLFYGYMYFAVFRAYAGLSHGSVQDVLVTLLGMWILFNLLFNHCMAAFASPGNVPEEAEFPAELVQELILKEVDQLEEQNEALSVSPAHREAKESPQHRIACYCAKCLIRKPKRAHHCGVCQRCVVRMDHHCPWIANCVGAHNYRYFVLFLMYLFFACLFFICLLQKSIFHSSPNDPDYNRVVFMCWVLAFATLFPIGGMTAFHLFLVATNQTTIEMLGNIGKRQRAKAAGNKWTNPYNEGLRNNLRQVFGDNEFPFSWLVPMQNAFYARPLEYHGMAVSIV
jgi:hypothetical protein